MREPGQKKRYVIHDTPSQKGMKILTQNQSPRTGKTIYCSSFLENLFLPGRKEPALPDNACRYYPDNHVSAVFVLSPGVVHILSMRLFSYDGLCPNKSVAYSTVGVYIYIESADCIWKAAIDLILPTVAVGLLMGVY
jgi:hypothetical protein